MRPGEKAGKGGFERIPQRCQRVVAGQRQVEQLAFSLDEAEGGQARLHENGYDTVIVELQMAHKVGNSVAAAYNRAERIKERTELMQAWADYLDQLEGREEQAETVC